METVAIGVYVTETTGQAAWTGAVAAAGFVPIAVLGPVGGALADRLPRRRLVLTANLVQGALAAVLAILFATGDPSAPLLTSIVFASGIVSAIGFPAYQAMLPDLVPTEDLAGAMGLSSAQWNLGRVIGPVLAGVVIEIGGYAWALGLNATSFLAVVAVLLTLHLPPPAPSTGDSLMESMAEGVRFLRDDPGLRVNVGAMAVNTLFAAPFIALVPAMSEQVFDAGARGTSVLVAAQGIGAVAMGLMLGTLTQRYGSRRVVATMLATLPVALAVYAYAPTLAASALVLMFVGALYLGALSSFMTIAQLRAPAHLRGRVLAVNNVVLGTLYPLGSVVQGRVADSVGLRATTAGAAVAMLAVLLVARASWPGAVQALDAPVEPASAGSPPTPPSPPR